MSRCSLCGRNVSDKNLHFGSTCMKNVYTIIGIENVKKSISETVLNNSIARLANKKSLNKNDKIVLTNRYLTLQLLNKVPIRNYDKMRKSLERDIDKIGKTKKMSKENNTITLKQAYEVYKLYNKFQKIKNEADEVDEEYIQNFLFDNLLFAFSTYYNNKKYLGGLLANIQYYFWKMIIAVCKKDYPLGTEFIEYALQEKPKDRLITEGYIVEEIKKDNNFVKKIEELIEKNRDKNEFEETSGLYYQKLDLFMALNNTTIRVKAIKIEEKWNLGITITDRYDFTDFKEIDEYQGDNFMKNFGGSLANNLGMVSVASGVFKEYNVKIQFSIEGWEKNE